MKRSRILKIAAGLRVSPSCRRLFLSVQMLDIVAWATSRLSVRLVTASRIENQSERAVHVWNARGWYPSLCITKSHISSLISQRRKRWSLFSSCKLQRQQRCDTFIPHLAKRDLVGRRSWCAIQEVKACFGTWPLNKILFVHCWICPLFLTSFHVLVEEKSVSSLPSTTQTYASSVVDSEGSCREVK